MAIAQPDRHRHVLNERPLPNEQQPVFHPISRCPVQPLSQSHYRPTTSATTQPSMAPAVLATGTAYPRGQHGQYEARQPTQQQLTTPGSGKSCSAESSASVAKMTNHSMSIPDRITTRGGSISDLMAEVAALFWFESAKLLDKVEKRRGLATASPVQPLAPTAVACQHFKKWVAGVLTTTQVTQNVVILALLYIYRLKKANPTVKGRPGSEYRLLTVALMLGNKFLDDNTYTNKTWADVSCISVNEIHVMEVEFLSNMRYSLLVSTEEWDQWLDKLKAFWSYLELAQRPVSPSPSPLLIPSPTHRSFISPLHSPVVPLTPNGHATRSFTLQSPNLAPLANGAPAWPLSYSGGGDAASPLALKPEPHPISTANNNAVLRKRPFPEPESAEPPAKRASRIPPGAANIALQNPTQFPPTAVPQAAQFSGLPHAGTVPPLSARLAPAQCSEQVRPQVPSLTLNITQVADALPYGAVAYPPQQAPLPLPPLASGVRAMAMVFPSTTYAPSQPIPATCGTVTPTTSFPPMTYGTPTKRLSPQNSLTAFPGSSPVVMGTPMGNGGATSGLHTPISHSPSIYLQQRNSPYKPVRHVNTLLYPPPSAFLQHYQLPNPVLPNQMHYQPLGKRNEYRTGIVPEFLDGVSRLAPYPLQVLPNPHVQQSRPQQQQYQARPPAPGGGAAPAYLGQY
ncbi:hypothetical protein C8A05DRAFT_12935 [Staphylotrichum tortipilum]|uniref:Cyclin n=1 Tax=Staphylotrichum tortipilum TaxID=2831512 RepID=A0AAN6MQI5_9PEZI|nr:hypothetical protein C8A05DRAFT_12935 [Staphylotrichum longicolle]